MNVPKKLLKFSKIKLKVKQSRKDFTQNIKITTEKLPAFSPRNFNSRVASPIAIQTKFNFVSGANMVNPKRNAKRFKSPNMQTPSIQNMPQTRNRQLENKEIIGMFSNSNKKTTARRISPKKLFKLVNGAKKRMKNEENTNFEIGSLDRSNNLRANDSSRLNGRYEINNEQSDKKIACLNTNHYLRDSPLNRTTYSKQAERVRRHKQYSNYFNTLNQSSTQDSNEQNNIAGEAEGVAKRKDILTDIKQKIAKINQEYIQGLDVNFGASKFNELI